MTSEEIWEKRRSESAKAFEAFAIYRGLGPKRSIAAVARILSKHVRPLKTWSGLHDWVARCHAYDSHIDLEDRQQQELDRRAMLHRHAQDAVAIQKKALAALKAAQPADLTTADIIRFWDVAVKNERLARGAGADDEQERAKEKYLSLWERLGGNAPTGTDG